MPDRILKYSEALKEALTIEMERDESVILFGEDVARHGGIYKQLEGLGDLYPGRVFDTPISENLIVGMSVGAAMRGMRPICELQFADFIFSAGDEVFLKMAYWRWAHDGAFDIPMVMRAPSGSFYGPEHSMCPEAYLMHTPGIRIAVPSTPEDAKGLMLSAIRSNDPVAFFEHKRLYSRKGHVPEGDYTTPFGKAKIRRKGETITVVAWQDMLGKSLEAADTLVAEGIDVEIIDPITLNPFDAETILDSVRKTGACVVVEEAPLTLGVGAEIGAQIMEKAYADLEHPLGRLGIPDTPMASFKHMYQFLIPGVDDIIEKVKEVLAS